MFTEAIEDLAKSGLVTEDVNARVASLPEIGACSIRGQVSGYVLPYFNLIGKPTAFYRIKLFGLDFKYAQPKQTSNHIYFPKNFLATLNSGEFLAKLKQQEVPKYIILCEGEKKAACATKMGYPAVGFGGVDSWKNKTLALPAQTDFAKVAYNKNIVSAKLPSSEGDAQEVNETILATGFLDLIDYVVLHKIHVIVIYDTDNGFVKPDVQRAAASLGFELRYRGVPFTHIHQLVLPGTFGQKVALDDVLVQPGGSTLLDKLIVQNFSKTHTFPIHPNIREYVNRKLQKAKLTRKECQQIAIGILADLDANGIRLRSAEEQQMYYFDNRTHRLMKVFFNLNQSSVMHSTYFGQLLYNNYGVSSADARILTWLDIQFNAEEPIEEVTPNRVLGIQRVSRTAAANNRHAVRYQINDGQYVKVSDSGLIQVMDNGADGFMFLSEQVEPIKAPELMEAIDKQKKQPLIPWWMSVLDETRLKEGEQGKTLLMLLYYVSPWLNKWQGMQLPVELVIGEPGSGKSSLYEHRLNVLTGVPKLRNAPSDLKDWHASITNAGGLHVTDNVNLVNRELRQRLSDELCRIVTEPNPNVEMRKLYSNNELISLPIHASFALTSIKQPFQNSDLIQRSIKVEIDKSQVEGEIEYDSNWVHNQMVKFGGRTEWIAHHIIVLERFFSEVKQHWNPKYKALHRLIHFEQSLRIMARVFGLEHDWIPGYLSGITEENIAKADEVIEGLKAFVSYMQESFPDEVRAGKVFPTTTITTWAENQEDFAKNPVLTNTRSLGRYIQNNKYLIRSIASIDDAGIRHNKQIYRILTK